MTKWMTSLMFVFTTFLLFTSCGSDPTTVNTVCSASGSRIFAVCDVTDPTDQQTIIDALAAFEITVTAEEVENGTEAELVTACNEALAGQESEITAEDATQFQTAINAADTCEEVANVMIAAATP